MQKHLSAVLTGAVGVAAAIAVAGTALLSSHITTLRGEIAELQGSVVALGGEVGEVAQVATGAASSTKNLAVDLAATSKAQTAALASQAAELSSKGGELQRAVAAVSPAVVSIFERDGGGSQLASGTGFVVRSTGYIVTNKHVVEDTRGSYYASFAGGKEKPVTIVWLSPTDDLAIIKIVGSGYPTVTLGDSAALAVGQQVFAIGNALGRFDNTVSVGVVSGLNRTITAADPYSGEGITLNGVIQTDAAINPGNSGGPLINIDGEAIGINSAIVFGAQNIGFAIPIDRAKKDLEEIKKHGHIRSPFLGVKYVLLNKTVADHFKISLRHGALVMREGLPEDKAVLPGSAAYEAGIKEHDVIVAANGKEITEKETLEDVLSNCNVGDKLNIQILRKNQKMSFDIILEDRAKFS